MVSGIRNRLSAVGSPLFLNSRLNICVLGPFHVCVWDSNRVVDATESLNPLANWMVTVDV